MFDLSWTELLLVGALGLVILKPEDMVDIIKHIRKFKRTMASAVQDITSSFKELEEDTKKTTDHIIDLNGNPQRTYDISEAQADIESFYKSDQPKKGEAIESAKDSIDSSSK